MTEKEKSRKEIEEEIAIIVTAMKAIKDILRDSFGRIWDLMHSEPYLSQKILLSKTEQGRKERDGIIASTVRRTESALDSYTSAAVGLLIQEPEDYDISFVNEETDGYVKRYSERFSDFAEAFIIAAILSDNGNKTDVWQQIVTYHNAPFVAPVFKSKNITRSTMTAILTPLARGLGKGNYISPFADFDRLTKYTIHRNFSWAKIYEMDANGYKWYKCFRNSNYDCPACDDVCAVPHRITEYVLPVHPNCVCGMYPINENEL